MFKKFLCLFLTAFTVFSLIPYNAYGNILSPGMEFIKKDVKVIKTCTYGENISFTKSDFYGITNGDFDSVTIRSLPDTKCGTLKFGNLDVFAGQVISADGIEFLTFQPTVSSVSCSFDISLGCGDAKCLLYVINRENSSPVCTSFKINTAENIPVFSRLKADDGDGDEMEYIITSQPENGLLTFTDSAAGIFKYTPHSGFKGTDSFTYRVMDKYGNVSDIATVTVKTSKNKSGIVYSDMSNDIAQYASLKLAESGILVGEKIGDNMYFSPSSTVSRSDFVVMAMKCANYSPDIYTQTNTGFEDDTAISSYARGYIITALNLGLPIEVSSNEKTVFSPNEPISEYDAARITRAILSEEKGDDVLAFFDDTVISTGTFGDKGADLNRRGAALLLNMIFENK